MFISVNSTLIKLPPFIIKKPSSNYWQEKTCLWYYTQYLSTRLNRRAIIIVIHYTIGSDFLAKPRGNDAIPSWSGFNYQGKIMLLCVLTKINDILNPSSLKEYSVELEKQEDFVIFHNKQPELFYQVKATLSKHKWRQYEKALDKLIETRNSSLNPTAACHLIVANKIEDWNNASNRFQATITIFTYSGDTVSLCDVKDCILQEIATLLSKKKHSTDNAEVAYGELCLYLDDSIAAMHQQGSIQRNYFISFSEIENIIITSAKNTVVKSEYYLKEKVYEYSTNSLMQALEQICTQKCHKKLCDCEIPCAAKNAYQRILALPDLIQYCKIINPDKTYGWNNPLTLISNMSSDKMGAEIFRLFIESKTPDKVDDDNGAVFFHSKYCSASNSRIIPTLLDLSVHNIYGQESLQQIFQNIKNNTEILNAISGNAITAIPGGCEGYLSQSQINSGWTTNATNASAKDNINNFYGDIEIISKKDLIEKFRENGGNND